MTTEERRVLAHVHDCHIKVLHTQEQQAKRCKCESKPNRSISLHRYLTL